MRLVERSDLPGRGFDDKPIRSQVPKQRRIAYGIPPRGFLIEVHGENGDESWWEKKQAGQQEHWV